MFSNNILKIAVPLVILALLSSCEFLSTKDPLLHFLVKQEYIGIEEANKIASNDISFTAIYKIYLKRYHLKIGEKRKRFYSSQNTDVKAKKLVKRLYAIQRISKEIFEDLNSRIAKEEITDDFMVFEYLYEYENKKNNLRQ